MAEKLIIPVFDPATYFTGTLSAYGVFVDRFGSVRRQFYVTVEGHRTSQGFQLDEAFVYDDGETEMRRWNVTKVGEERYTGICADVVGHASGHLKGNMLSWRYKFRLPLYGRKVAVTFDDVMVLQEAGILINRAVVSKWGIKLGEVLISFRPAV